MAAIDLGATSVRVSLVDLASRPIEPRVVHRYEHTPRRYPDGSLRWDWENLVAQVRHGLDLALATAAVASIGIDGWGLDYGLIDNAGQLIAPPHSYRDDRVARWGAVADRIGRRALYDTTGIQLMAGNTIFQLAAHDRRELDQARHVLMIPALLVHDLCGAVTAERTAASTTALVDHRTRTWSSALIRAVDADPTWFPEIQSAGQRVGAYAGVPIHQVGSHDTASAVLAMAADQTLATAFVSGGTLFLVGRETTHAHTDDQCYDHNLSNEAGAFGGIRLLSNLPGMWLLEQCRRQWAVPTVAELLSGVPETPGTRLIDTADASLVNPDDLPAAVCALAGLPVDTDRSAIVSCLVDSMAADIAAAVDRLEAVGPIDRIIIFGGASNARPLIDRLAHGSGRPVDVGTTEATTIGNALAQGIALDYWDGPAEARRSLASER